LSYDVFHYELSESVFSTYSIYDDATRVDWSNGNDSSGSFSSAEVASPASDYPGTIINALQLNAYKSGGMWTDADHLNVECAWVAWVDLKDYAETGSWEVHESAYGYSGEGTGNSGCDGTFDTTVDLSGEAGMVFTGLYLDGEDCGIETRIDRSTLGEVYDENAEDGEGSYYSGAETYYYQADGDGGEVDTSAGKWCKRDEGNNDDWDCKMEEGNGYSSPDMDITNFSGDDVAIVGLGIAANGNGKRCGINIYVEYQEIFRIEEDWAEFIWEEDADADTEDEDEAAENDDESGQE
jgi:hypothetical protein